MKFRDPISIMQTRGYVVLLKGEPGTGKTSFALAAGARYGRLKYISFSEPEEFIRSKLVKMGGRRAQLEFSAILSSGDIAISSVLSGLESGWMVVIDSINALLDATDSRRSIQQLLYGASKGKKGVLVLIHEGRSESEADYISDAILEFGYEDIYGRRIRKVSVLKDRNYPTTGHPYLYTFNNGRIRIFNGSLRGKTQDPQPIRSVVFPVSPYPYLSESNILVLVSRTVHRQLVKLMKVFFASYYSMLGKKVMLEASPDEDPEEIKKLYNKLTGGMASPAITRKPYLKTHDDGVQYLRSLESAIRGLGSRGVLIVDTLPDESFVLLEPAQYNLFAQQKIELLLRYNYTRLIFSYESFASTRVQEKYADAVKALTDYNGTLVWVSLKPPGNAYAIEVDFAKSSLRNFLMV
ncbi:MAG: RAD55 family ATPase [Nitrososphaeria archaeon]